VVIRPESEDPCILEQQTVDSPFEIDAESGILRFPHLRLSLAPQQPLAHFFATDVGSRAKAERSSRGWQVYKLKQDLPDGRRLGISLVFFDGRLSEIRFDYRSEGECDWSSWSQQRELARVQEYHSEIARQLGKWGRFRWGIADAGYDDKAASAVLFVNYLLDGENMSNRVVTQSSSSPHNYLLANDNPEAPRRFAALAELFDSGTVRNLEKRGVSRGSACLEVGGGGGSIARWLADRVGPTGHVLVTDIDPRFLEPLKHSGIEVRRHNIVTDPPLETAFDLVYTRLVLLHLPQREQALERMISALKPGGWLLVEEYDTASMPPDPVASPGEVFLKAHTAMLKFFDDGGVDRRYGRKLFARLRAHGLSQVGAEARVFMFKGASPGASLLKANLEQLRTPMIDRNYITPKEFDEDLARLDDPDFMTPSGILWSAWGCRQ
jgi:SAM-dependent methyltransferase